MRRICFLAPASEVDHPRLGGKVATWLHENGYDVEFIGFAGQVPVPYKTTLVVKRKRWWRLLGFPRTVRELWRHRNDVVILAGVETLVFASVVNLFVRARLVFDAREDYLSRFSGSLARPAVFALRHALRWSSRSLVLLVSARAENVSDYPKAAKSVVFRNPAPLSEARASAGQPGEPLRVISLGLLGRGRGSEVIARAVRLLGDRGINMELWVVGEFEDDSEGAIIAAAAASPSVEYRRWAWRPYAEALELASQCHVGLICFQPINANLANPMPNKAFDYMAIGLPFVAPASAPELAAILEESNAGLLVDVTSPEAVAEAILAVGTDPELWARLSDTGLRAALTTLSLEAQIAPLAREIEALARE
jgi:glycosyltransferase involved in cell wall biosynthesis